jgi:group I intron endonuclease
MLEFNPINILKLPVKKTLNSIAGTYICINLINDKTYVGSASINCMYRRYTGHLLKGIGGNLLVKHAVLIYGLENFAFVVIETTKEVKNKEEILRIEQKYIDLLLPEYNIAKIAGSRLNTK